MILFHKLLLLLLPLWLPGKFLNPETAAHLKPSLAEQPVLNKDVDWQVAAAEGQQALLKNFWSAQDRYFYQNNKGNKAFNYWWQAHAMDVLLDGYERSGDKKYLDLVSELHAGVEVKNGGTFYNEYYDDMEWMALACLRAFSLSGDVRYKHTAQLLWEDIKTGWSLEFGGGISWKKTQRNYKNSPANAPAAILAARLYQLNKNKEDLAWAQKIYAWEKQHLVDPETGLVWDGFNRQGNHQIDKNWKFSYNQGIFIGAGLELYKATHQKTYLQDACKTARYIVTSPDFFPGGILKSEGSGDGGLFKGIFIRYLTQLIQQGNLIKGEKARYIQVLETNGAVMLQQGTLKPGFLFGKSPNTLPGESTDSSLQLSGVMLLEALAKLEKHRP